MWGNLFFIGRMLSILDDHRVLKSFLRDRRDLSGLYVILLQTQANLHANSLIPIPGARTRAVPKSYYEDDIYVKILNFKF